MEGYRRLIGIANHRLVKGDNVSRRSFIIDAQIKLFLPVQNISRRVASDHSGGSVKIPCRNGPRICPGSGVIFAVGHWGIGNITVTDRDDRGIRHILVKKSRKQDFNPGLDRCAGMVLRQRD